MRNGRIEQLDIAPQATGRVKIAIGPTDNAAEWLLNLRFILKEQEGLLPAGHVAAHSQLVLKPYRAPQLTVVPRGCTLNDAPLRVKDNDRNYLRVQGEGFVAEFNRRTGYLCRYDVHGTPLLKEGHALTPHFWRAPTDNDMGALLQLKYAPWRRPDIRLQSLTHQLQGDSVTVSAKYELPALQAALTLTYAIGRRGAIRVTQQLAPHDHAARV